MPDIPFRDEIVQVISDTIGEFGGGTDIDSYEKVVEVSGDIVDALLAAGLRILPASAHRGRTATDYKRQIASCIAYACLNQAYANDAAQTLSNNRLIDDRGTWEQGYAIGYEEGVASVARSPHPLPDANEET